MTPGPEDAATTTRDEPPPGRPAASWRDHLAPSFLAPFCAPLYEVAVPFLLDLPADEPAILDVGCGRGHNTNLFAHLGMRAQGIDLNADVIDIARESYPSLTFHCHDVQELPFDDASFDATFSFSVLQYVDWRRVLRECDRVLRPGGRAVFIENLAGSPLAKAYRAAHRLFGWRYVACQTPRGHIDWSDRREFAQVFANVACEAFHLTDLLVLIGPGLKRALLKRPLWVKPGRCFSMLHRFDGWLLRRWASLAGRCWLAVICAEKRT